MPLLLLRNDINHSMGNKSDMEEEKEIWTFRSLWIMEEEREICVRIEKRDAFFEDKK
jgi:hypothetical protein